METFLFPFTYNLPLLSMLSLSHFAIKYFLIKHYYSTDFIYKQYLICLRIIYIIDSKKRIAQFQTVLSLTLPNFDIVFKNSYYRYKYATYFNNYTPHIYQLYDYHIFCNKR